MFQSLSSNLRITALTAALSAVAAGPVAAQHHTGGHAPHGGVVSYFNVGVGVGVYNPNYGYPGGSTTNYYYPSNPVIVQNPATVAPPVPNAPPANSATVDVRLPAGAQLWFNDTPMTSQNGAFRTYDTPPLTPEKNYHYTVRARWIDKGQVIEQVRRVDVMAGRRSLADFTQAELAPKPSVD